MKFRRIVLVAVAVLFCSAGPIFQNDLRAGCETPRSFYREYYRWLRCDAEGCVPQKEIVGWEMLECDGTYTSWGYTSCTGITRCSTDYFDCPPVCDDII